MSEGLLPSRENSGSELLSEFQKLFGLINNLDNVDLSTVAKRIKELIFNQLRVTGKIASEISYETWLQEMLPNNESSEPTRLLEMAKKYNIINPESTSEILRKKLIQLLNAYKDRNRFSLNQTLIAEIEEAASGSEITPSQYDTLAGRLLSLSYGG